MILGSLVLIHEFGHFIAAKKTGVKVEEFGIGFPPRLLGIKHGETLYSINLIPLGGFVKVYGEEYREVSSKKTDSKLKNRAFAYKKPYQKAAIVIAGVVMNFLLAIAIYYALLLSHNFQSDIIPVFKPTHFKYGTPEGRVVVGALVKDSPAQGAGITPEDIVLFARSSETKEWTKITSAKQIIEFIKNQANKPIYIWLLNSKNSKEKTVMVIPKMNYNLKRAVIGVNLVDAVVINYTKPGEKLLAGILHSYNIAYYNFDAIGYFVGHAIKEKNLGPVSETVSGPVGIFKIIDNLVKTSGQKFWVNILNTVALLSLSLGTLNILPFPALDGGRLVFILYEWVTRKRINEKVEKYVNLFGILVLLTLAAMVTMNDIFKPFQ